MDRQTSYDGEGAVSAEEGSEAPQATVETQVGSVVEAIDAESIAYISLVGAINEVSQSHLLETCYQCHHEGVRTVYLFMSTPGGEVDCGVTMYNVLKDMPFNLITHNVGMVASIGNVIFLAGEMRYAVRTGCFLFHEVSLSYSGDLVIGRNQMREWTDSIKYSELQIGAVLRERTSFLDADIEKSFERQSTEDSEFAFSHNIIHGIMPLHIVRGAPITAIRTS